MKTLFSLPQLSREELLELADSRIPAALASQVEAEALPPAFVARRSLKLVAEGKPEFWRNPFLIVHNSTGRIIGSRGLKDRPKDGRVEIGNGLAPNSRGQGGATAPVKLLLNSGTRVDEDNETVVQWVWKNDLHPLALVGLQQ